MNEISTTLYKVNWEYLINNCLNQNFWKNNWKVFEVDGITLTLTINQIDVYANRVVFKLDGKDWDYTYIQIPLNANHFNIEVFNKSLYNECKRIIETKERRVIRNLAEYESALEKDDDANNENKCEVRAEGLAKLFEGLTEDDLNSDQDDALRRYVTNTHNDYYPLSEGVIERLQHQHKPSWYGLLALTLGKPEDYDTWLKEQPGVLYVDVVEDAYDHIDLEEMEDE